MREIKQKSSEYHYQKGREQGILHELYSFMGFSSFVVSPTGVSSLPLAPYEQDIFNCEEVQLCCRSHLII